MQRLRNVIAIMVGLIIGAFVNGAILKINS